MRIDITPEDAPLVTQIVSGLLASGHFTYPIDEECNDREPGSLRADCGKDWEADGWSRRFTSYAVEEAMTILKEIKFACQHDAYP